MPGRPSTVPSLNALSYDLKDLIARTVESPNDLLQLALSNRAWRSIIIPNHLEYRVLIVRSYQPEMWKHLAERKDLTLGVRTVTLSGLFLSTEGISRRDQRQDQCPRTLVEKRGFDAPAGKMERNDIVTQALRNMTYLTSFEWALLPIKEYSSGTSSGGPLKVRNIFEALRDSTTLVHLKLRLFGDANFDDQEALESEEYPFWKIRGLRQFILLGCWSKWGEGSNLARMLGGLVDLEELSIRFDPASPSFISCAFPRLRRLRLGRKGPTASLEFDQRVTDFLARHANIEYLEWYPYNVRVQISSDFLPRLRSLASGHAFILHFLQATANMNPPLERIRKLELTQEALSALKIVAEKHLLLRYVSMDSFESLAAISGLGELFPSIQALEYSAGDRRNPDIPWRDMLDAISTFPRLRILSGFFVRVYQPWEKIDEVVVPPLVLGAISAAAPSLCQVTLSYGAGSGPNSMKTTFVREDGGKWNTRPARETDSSELLEHWELGYAPLLIH